MAAILIRRPSGSAAIIAFFIGGMTPGCTEFTRMPSDANCTAADEHGRLVPNVTSWGEAEVPHGCPADVRHAILSDPPYAPGGGRYAGFFVAPVAADYAFTGYFDTGAELWLSENGDPRLAALALGGGARAPPADGDVVDGYERRNSSWCVPSRLSSRRARERKRASARERSFLRVVPENRRA